MITKTFKEIQEVNQLIGELYQKDKSLQDSKFGYACKRFLEKNYNPIIKEAREELMDIRINNAMEDKTTKEILKDQTDMRGFKYTKEGLKKCIQEENDLNAKYESKEIECEPYISSYVPVLTEEQIAMLKDLIIE